MDCGAVIFDLDGTLGDTLADLAGAMNWALGELGMPTHTADACRMFIGEGVGTFAERALPTDERHRVDELLALYRERYAAHCFDQTDLYDGVADLLDGLTERGVAMAVLSNKPDAATGRMVERLMGKWTFAAVRGETAEVARKPAPDGALAIAGALGVARQRVVFVGDSKTDMQTATAAGMAAVGVAWGFRDRAELVEHGAGQVIKHPMDLLKLIDEV
ncbi:MAG: hypothetical protein CMJ49_10970 [Planctomycetaceae bacterium]|nr:hypothetical protein [Planctomycetaceae bacterium]